MIRRTILTILLSIGAGVCVADAAGVTVALKNAVRVEGGGILLGEVASVTGRDEAETAKLAALALGDAPWPGQTRIVTRDLVLMRIAGLGVRSEDLTWGGAESCAVTVRTVSVSGEEMVKAAREQLKEIPMFREDGVEIQAESVPRATPVAASEKPTLEAAVPTILQPWGRIKVYVRILDGERVLGTVPVTFNVTCRRNVLFAARPIRRGDTIDAADLEEREVVLGPMSGGAVYALDRSEVAGKRAAIAVAAGTALTRAMVEEPLATRRGESVALFVRSKHIEVSAKGVSKDDARVGDTVSISVLGTGKTVLCKVVGPGAVELSL